MRKTQIEQHIKYGEWSAYIKEQIDKGTTKKDIMGVLKKELDKEDILLHQNTFYSWLRKLRVYEGGGMITPQMWEKGRDNINYFAFMILGVYPHKGQSKFFREVMKSENDFILCPANQWGKSFAMAVFHIWAAFYKYRLKGWEEATKKLKRFQSYPYQTVNLSPIMDQASMVYQYILDILTSNFSWMVKGKLKTNQCKIPGFLVSPLRLPSKQTLSSVPIVYNNNSQTLVRSTKHDKAAGIQGKQFGLITYDECALSRDLEAEITARIPSRLITYNGQLVLVSTPDRDREEEANSETYDFYRTLVEQGIKGEGNFSVMIGKITDNSFLNQEDVEKKRKRLEKLDPDMAKQVFEGAFTASRWQFFKSQAITQTFVDGMEEQEPRAGREYVVGADFASGGQGWTVFTVADVTGGYGDNSVWPVVRMERFKGNAKSPISQIELLIQLSENYNNAEMAVDTSSLGGSIIANLLDEFDAYGNKFATQDKKDLIFALRKWLEWKGKGKFRIPKSEKYLAMRRELATYREQDQKLTKDCVMSLGLIAWRMEEKYYDHQASFDEGFDFFSEDTGGYNNIVTIS